MSEYMLSTLALPMQSARPVVATDDWQQRLLVETRKMIADFGIERFSVRELCRTAEISPRTLYASFHNRDSLIVLVIRQAYQGFDCNRCYQTSAETLEGIIDRLLCIDMRNFRTRNYVRAITSIYFSQGTGTDLWMTLREMLLLDSRQWLDRLARDGELACWADPEEVENNLANTGYSVIHDWARGWIADEDFLCRLVTAILSLVAGVTIGENREMANLMLHTIARTNRLPKFAKSCVRD